ncbi:MAG TPA: NADH-quinone oxidoreductase subunit NuoG, partial [Ramlibacter sp.]|nr:NADH-quinone oxidoreductase subunit NuoG [Ramlibacter sp.]
MIEIELDGQKVEITEGSMIMHAAEKAGTYIPHFCYHKKLSIAANCRMCLVEVEKAPKPMPACATPVAKGMIVRTKSDKALKAQRSVMEFLLINHPLDCPICDQGGECQLQDLAVGYGAGTSRYDEEKRVVAPKDVGPLISMEEMSRCIHCTRCVRFGQELAGVMELGMIHRGEHAEITTVLGDTVDSEVSGNMIDLCPVGALTSKPFRYQARNWELSRRKSVSPHDSTGANLIVQVKNNKVMRVLPFENEEVNECWLADRDRFSYEALNSDERLTQPMVKHGGEWKSVDWQTALEYVANGLRQIKADHGAQSIGALVSPHSTVEELYLAGALVRGLGSENIDYRLRNAQFAPAEGVRWLGTSIAALSNLQGVLVVGSNLRKDHPLFAMRIRAAARNGAAIAVINDVANDWAMPIATSVVAPAANWLQSLADVAAAVAAAKGGASPAKGNATDAAKTIAQSLIVGERKAVLLGNAAAHHADATSLLALANWIAAQTGATVGYLTEAANTVGAQLVGALPGPKGLNAAQMLAGSL